MSRSLDRIIVNAKVNPFEDLMRFRDFKISEYLEMNR